MKQRETTKRRLEQAEQEIAQLKLVMEAMATIIEEIAGSLPSDSSVTIDALMARVERLRAD